jgi:hypothetical protein
VLPPNFEFYPKYFNVYKLNIFKPQFYDMPTIFLFVALHFPYADDSVAANPTYRTVRT